METGLADLQAISDPCALSTCDVFLTHSWDDDGELKRAAVAEWCTQFEAADGQPPLLWLDTKICRSLHQPEEYR